LLEVRIGILEPRARKNPVNIRVRQICDVAAAGARRARRVCSSAKETLSQPKSETLLADAARALQQQAGRERTGANAFGEALAKVFVSVKVDDRHVEI
jgi:hypothetical protein